MDSVPFLKWAGGKRWLAPKISAMLKTTLNLRLVEPFLGSGAVFFFLRPGRALLADLNPELIATYRAVRDNPDDVIRRLRQLTICKDVFEYLRRSSPRSDVSRAVRLIYLNRTAFNGLYRVNRRGEFNVPFGCKPGTEPCDADSLNGAAHLLRRAEIKCQDFRETLQATNPINDILYVDPPYTVKHDNNGFRRYNDRIFTWDDQKELARLLVALANAGAKIVVSNANHSSIRRMYPTGLFQAVALRRATCMAADSIRRGTCHESLIVSNALIANRQQLKQALAGR
jgi:DNA adenine methylase